MENYSPSASHLSEALRIIRARQDRHGVLAIPKNLECPCCGKFHPIDRMPVIRTTGVVDNVVDCLCRPCWAKHAVEFRKLCRIVCVGCREVVAVLEPGKEKTGFVWKAGSCLHVAECPVCTPKRGKLRSSQIVEKLVYFQKNNIPYEL